MRIRGSLFHAWIALFAIGAGFRTPPLGAAAAQTPEERVAPQIRLVLDRGGWTRPNQVRPLGTGVPLRQGQLRNTAGLTVTTAAGRPVPAVFEIRRRYGDGSIQWLWVDFQAPAASHYVLGLGSANPVPTPGVQVQENARNLIVTNGVLELRWNRNGATPMAVSLLADDAAAARAEQDTLGDGIYLVAADGRRAVMAGSAAELQWTVETANPLRATLLVEGWYTHAPDSEHLARGRVRYHIFWNQPHVEMEHSFIVTRSNDEVTYREIGIHWPFAAGPNAQARFGLGPDRPPLEMTCSDTATAWICQDRYPLYHTQEKRCRAGLDDRQTAECPEASGWCELRNSRAGLGLGVKDFAPQFPKELTASALGVTAKLWSARGGRILDYRPRTLIAEWWGEWFDRIMETYCRDGMPEALREKSAWDTYNPSCIGVARTHELLFVYQRPDAETDVARDAFRAFQTEPLVLPDPRWTCHAGARTFWPMAAKDEGGPAYDDLERLISTWFDQYSLPQQTFPFTGWYDWGRVPVDRYAVDRKEDALRVWAHWFRIGIVNRYMFNKYLMVAWARSGERKYYDMATRLNRFIRDYYVLQAGADKGCFNQSTPWLLPTWGGGSLRPGVDSENMTGLALEYLFRGSAGCKDALLRHQQALVPAFHASPTFTSTQPDMLANSMLGVWRVTGDPTLEAQIRTLHRAWTNIDDPGGIRVSFFKHWAGSHYENPFYKLDRKVNAIIEYALTLGDAADRALALKAARALAPRYRTGTEPISYCNLSGAACGYAYGWDKDPEFLATVTYQAEAARRLFLAFEQLPAAEKGIERWLSRAKFSKSSYEASFTFPELGLWATKKDGRGRDVPLRLMFGVSTAAAPLFSLPVAIGVLSGTL